MKLKIKNINLKDRTLRDIATNRNNCDVDYFAQYVKEKLTNINDLVNTKIVDLESKELYDKLKYFYEFTVEPKDYLRALAKMFKRHYVAIINVKTTMADPYGRNIGYELAVTNEYLNLNNHTLDVKTIRKLTNRNDILVTKEYLLEDVLDKQEKYENHKNLHVKTDKEVLDENDEIFPYLIDLMAKKIRVKDILYDLKIYMDKLMYQAHCITSLAKIKDDPELASIGKRYDDALKVLFNKENKEYLTKPKISVRYHKRKPNNNKNKKRK